MEMKNTISVNLSVSSAKLVDGNVCNTLHYMINQNEARISQLVDEVKEKLGADKRYEDSADHNAQLRTIAWLDANLEEQKPALEKAKAHFKATYGVEWQPKASNATSKTTVMSKYFAKKAA